MSNRTAQLWAAVDALVARAPGVGALRFHRLDLLAAARRQARGEPVDPALREGERIVAMRALAVPHLLQVLRRTVDGPLVLMKGPEVAAGYPSPDWRPFGDLDVFTPDPGAAFAALLATGFTDIGKCDAGHHAPPLVWPGVPLTIELHGTVKWITGHVAPPTDHLLDLTRPSATGLPGIEAFIPAAHAVLLAVHAWGHGPLQCLGQLIDVAVMLDQADPAQAAALAQSWGCERLWRTTCDAIDALLGQHASSAPLRTWARHLRSNREPRVVERAVARIAGPLWALPPRQAAAAIAVELLHVPQRYDWETREEQLQRTRQALRHPFKPISEFRT